MLLAGASFQAERFRGGIMAFQETRSVDTDEYVANGSTLSAAVDGLTYLMLPGDDMEMVGLYARQLDARVRDMEALLRSDDPNVRGVRARLVN
jgi:hypothetical protein